MGMRLILAMTGIAGGLVWGGAALAQQPINLMAPTPLAAAPRTGIRAAPLPPEPAVTTLPLLPAARPPGYGAATPYLETAQASLSRHRYTAAGEALERAETRLLNNGAGTGQESGQAATEALLQVRLARQAVAERDGAGALGATGRAMAAIQAADNERQSTAVAAAEQPARPAPFPATTARPPMPMITKALLPGHWRLSSWQYHWVPPETRLRSADTRAFVPGHYVWRDGAWKWDSGHYGGD
jgi:hypothetical protein